MNKFCFEYITTTQFFFVFGEFGSSVLTKFCYGGKIIVSIGKVFPILLLLTYSITKKVLPEDVGPILSERLRFFRVCSSIFPSRKRSLDPSYPKSPDSFPIKPIYSVSFCYLLFFKI